MFSDPHRPRYHFLPPANWMNDPNGLIQWKGQYHLFYQYNPETPMHGNIHWGHAVSTDLVHWTHLPIALTPTPGRADADGCWSGCAVDNHGTPILLYTGIRPQVVCLATSSDDLLTWHYYSGNPVIAGPPPTLQEDIQGEFRDPFVWKEGHYWYMLMGSRRVGKGGMILLYRSYDLITWEYLHPLLVADASKLQSIWTGAMWECPNLLPFGDRRLLFFSSQTAEGHLLYPIYIIGTFQDEQFSACTQAILAHGGSFYAPQAFYDAQGRAIMWGWLQEERSQSLCQQAGWAGVLSLPIVLSLSSEDRLNLEPAPELAILREKHWHDESFTLSGTGQRPYADSRGDCLEILLVSEPEQHCTFGLRLRCSPDGQEQTRIVYQAASQQLFIEREQSSINPDVNHENCSVAIELAPGEPLMLHIFLDRSVLEVFVNNRYYLANRIYPERQDNLGLDLFVRAGSVKINALDIWHLASIWNS